MSKGNRAAAGEAGNIGQALNSRPLLPAGAAVRIDARKTRLPDPWLDDSYGLRQRFVVFRITGLSLPEALPKEGGLAIPKLLSCLPVPRSRSLSTHWSNRSDGLACLSSCPASLLAPFRDVPTYIVRCLGRQFQVIRKEFCKSLFNPPAYASGRGCCQERFRGVRKGKVRSGERLPVSTAHSLLPTFHYFPHNLPRFCRKILLFERDVWTYPKGSL